MSNGNPPGKPNLKVEEVRARAELNRTIVTVVGTLLLAVITAWGGTKFTLDKAAPGAVQQAAQADYTNDVTMLKKDVAMLKQELEKLALSVEKACDVLDRIEDQFGTGADRGGIKKSIQEDIRDDASQVRNKLKKLND